MFKKTTTKKDGSVEVVEISFGKGPDMHGWAFIAFFMMTMYILWMLQQNPLLLGVPSFMQFAGQLVAGGVLAAAAWLWTANKAKEDSKASRDSTVNVATSGNINVEKSDA